MLYQTKSIDNEMQKKKTLLPNRIVSVNGRFDHDDQRNLIRNPFHWKTKTEIDTMK